MKFKKGDRVKVILSGHTRENKIATIIKVNNFGEYSYNVKYDNDNSRLTEGFNDEHLELSNPTLEDMPEGTIIVDDGTERKVLFVLRPGLYVMSLSNGLDMVGGLFTAAELKSDGYKIKDSDTIEIVFDGNTKTISRQSAKELNLID